jgi:uncharacterized protein (DUF1800 family)
MALDSRMQAAVALNRFGFMPKTGVPSDPRAALLADLTNPTAGQIVNHELPSVGEAARATFAFRQERREERLEKAANARGSIDGDGTETRMVALNAKPDVEKQGPGVPQQIYLQEAKARFDAALSAEIGFVERLVWFWSNHFCVSADKGPVRSLCGTFEREAIRPHVRGKFADMLLAVETHPAMLLYLDNEGRAVLLALARSPATAKHIASKLARHFVADEPPPSLVEGLAKRFRDTDGDLMEVSRMLVTAPEAWDAPPSKLRRPSEWLVNALRALNLTPPDVRPFLQAQNMLGEPLWRPPAPNGFSDESAPWMDGLAQRLDIANNLSRRAGEFIDPDAVASRALGPLLSKETKQTVALAGSRPQAIALLLMAPEFQRR